MKTKIPIILFALLTFLVYYLLSKPTNFDYYTRLAKSFLQGKLYLEENPSWLNELVPDPQNSSHFYVVYPPMPAIVSIPFVLVNNNISQTTISIIFGTLNFLLMFLVAKKIFNNEKTTTPLWIAVLLTFGTNHFFLAVVGSSWYIAHIISIFFLLLAALEALNKKRPLLIGLLLGASYWSRLPTILSLPFFLLMTKDKYFSFKNLNIKNSFFLSTAKTSLGVKIKNYGLKIDVVYLLKLFLGLFVFLDLNFIYNYLRFGTIFDVGYTLIPGVLKEPWYQYGLFSIKYIPDHLKFMLTELPSIQKDFPYIVPSFMGMAIWITTPAFFLALLAPIKKLLTMASLSAVILIAPVSLMHGGLGWSQFGFRYAMDYTLFLILLITQAVGNHMRWYHKLLIILSVLINLWGVILNKFGWARF